MYVLFISSFNKKVTFRNLKICFSGPTDVSHSVCFRWKFHFSL